jgi:kynurenine formamidase
MFVLLSYKIDALTPAYGGKKGFSSVSSSSIKKGNSANTEKWEFPNHLGTHIDFPYHFHQNGQTVEDSPLDFWVFDGEKVQILEIDLPEDDLLIKPKHIKNQKIDFDTKFLIIKTSFGRYRSEEKYWRYNPGLSIEITEWIKTKFKKLRIIGIDSISISSWQHRDVGRKVHRKMLDPKNPILIIEDMDLSKVNKDTVFKMLYVAPIMVSKSDGGPCTILAGVK